MKVLKIEGNGSIVRDARSGAIININTPEMQLAKARKAARKQQQLENQNLQRRVERLESIVEQLLKDPK